MNFVNVENEWPQLKDCEWSLLWEYCSSISYYDRIHDVQLKFHPPQEFEEKMNDIYLLVSNINFCVKDEKGNSTQFRNASLGHTSIIPIKLSKQTKYKYDLPRQLIANDCVRYCEANFDKVANVRVEVVFLGYSLNIISEVSVPPLTIRADLGSLLTFTTEERNKKFTDIEIIIKQGEGTSPVHLFAHKAILAARSPVFEKMFEHDLKEKVTNAVDVVDIDPEVFKELLTYIYTEKAPNIKTLASPLLRAAEKYQLKRLKALCEQRLSYDLQVSNSAETLVLAHTYQAQQLKKNALKYIIRHRDEVRNTKDWETVHNINDLIEDLLDMALELAKLNKKQ